MLLLYPVLPVTIPPCNSRTPNTSPTVSRFPASGSAIVTSHTTRPVF